jgi:tRNA (guanine-N7-)-methyltransferase
MNHSLPPPQPIALEPIRNTHIKSFVKRRGHISKAQERWFEEGMPKWGLPYRQHLLNFDMVFSRPGLVWLEIGFGMGESTARIATANPNINYLGLEIFTAGVGALLKRIDEQQLQNIRIISHDAVEVLRDMIPNNSLDRVMIYFPDPWPKLRHHKRRLIQSPFINALADKLSEGGLLHCATDWAHYAEQILDVIGGCPLLKNTSSGFAPRPDTRPITKFEQRGLRLGHGVWDIIFQKTALNSDS